MPLLIRALDDPEPMVRLEAAASLRCIGRQAKPAATALRRLAADDPNELIRDMAAEALEAVNE